MDGLRLLWLSARSLAGRRFWIVTLFPLIWPALQVFRLQVGWRPVEFSDFEAQNLLIGAPLVMLSILLGVRVIASEIDRRTLEIAYTVPGGAHRVWLAKFAVGAVLVLVAEIWLALATWILLTPFPPAALYGAFQAGVFYLAIGMGLGALFRSETTGALGGVGVLTVNWFITGFGQNQIRFSPFWNPEVPSLARFDPGLVFAWTLQNRIGFVLAVAGVVALSVARAERRERLLSD